jgi:hypothetical protein
MALATYVLPMSRAVTTSPEPLVSFVIPVRNDAGNLARCLTAIRAQPADRSIEVIVADNGSTDPSRDVARSFGATVLQIADVPVSTLRNEGLRLARGGLIAFIDADNEMAPGWLAAAIPHFADPRIGAVGRDYTSPPGGTWVQRVYDGFRSHPSTIQPVRWLASGNVMVRRSAALEIDGFDETLDTSEDFVFCNRLRQRGYEILSDPALASTHFGDPQTLRDLFKSERWRGRDTLRVGLRGVPSLSDLPSMLFPVVDLAAMAVLISGVAFAWPVGRHLLWIPPLVIAALSSVRALRMLTRVPRREPGIFAALWIVAVVYDIARALALVSRTRHRGATAGRKRSQVAA